MAFWRFIFRIAHSSINLARRNLLILKQKTKRNNNKQNSTAAHTKNNYRITTQKLKQSKIDSIN